MTDENRNELEALRRRAYGPHPDIHLDAHAVSRLRELESSARPMPETATRRDDGIAGAEAPPGTAAAEPLDVPGIPEEAGRRAIDWTWIRTLLARLSKVRRSTAFIVLGAVVAVVLALTVLTVVQRVQADPLQVGAEQVARLSSDASFELPEFFVYVGSDDSLEGFQEFYGLRTVANFGSGDWNYNGGAGDCMSVYSAADMKPDANSFSGLMLTGCAAGEFPAMIQFGVEAREAPEELRAAFPDAAAFQFVLDTDNREIVVFTTP